MDTAFVGTKGAHYVMARLVDLLMDRVKAIPAAASVQDLDQWFPESCLRSHTVERTGSRSTLRAES
jgi:hypothetical protein